MIALLRASAGKSAAAEEVTVMTPAFDVEIDATYLLGADAPDAVSHPHALAAGRAVLVDDWTVSVIEVRHADAARITSEILALAV